MLRGCNNVPPPDVDASSLRRNGCKIKPSAFHFAFLPVYWVYPVSLWFRIESGIMVITNSRIEI